MTARGYKSETLEIFLIFNFYKFVKWESNTQRGTGWQCCSCPPEPKAKRCSDPMGCVWYLALVLLQTLLSCILLSCCCYNCYSNTNSYAWKGEILIPCYLSFSIWYIFKIPLIKENNTMEVWSQKLSAKPAWCYKSSALILSLLPPIEEEVVNPDRGTV